MDCEHDWKSFQTDLDNGGYMVIKVCRECKETEGFGFVDSNHELNYLENLSDTTKFDIMKYVH